MLTKVAIVIALLTSTCFAETLTGRVIGVHDGDTATLLTADNQTIKIRLAQIDAPELGGQPYGDRSKQSLSDLIYSKNVTVEIESKDQYKRSVGRILVGGMDANLEQVRRGMAWFYVQYGRDASYRDAESKAKENKLGLWADSAPTPPWAYRRESKSQPAPQANFNLPKLATSSSSSCSNKHYCKEMSNCAEALMYLNQCGVKSLDRDGDGVPCESLCKTPTTR
ncbi:thermonuclease family protein [Iodobacter sp. CM08]|uniref:thermonuclease family protein n=1 Tax=Iodobacter sp. CM08 TaxID=3085902 RepID=UPI002980DE44|nr:thermonuclease family protein [Iodobacter sp. CM08]MDW5419162.1 thermonuclease family protein [Iodobacter sp. CM08]